MRIVFTFLSLIVSFSLSAQDSPVFQEIKRLNEAMEEAFEQGDMKAVSNFYLDDAVMLAPGQEPVSGRKAIDAYWARTTNPVSWELEVIEVSPDEADIYENEYFQALDQKPPSWRVEGFPLEAEEQALVYELGRSTLTTSRGDKTQTSVVTFILVWKYTEEGYRILVDTYSW